MLGINVTQSDENLVIKWQLSKFEIPLSEIVEVTQDDTYGGSEKMPFESALLTAQRTGLSLKHSPTFIFYLPQMQRQL